MPQKVRLNKSLFCGTIEQRIFFCSFFATWELLNIASEKAKFVGCAIFHYNTKTEVESSINISFVPILKDLYKYEFVKYSMLVCNYSYTFMPNEPVYTPVKRGERVGFGCKQPTLQPRSEESEMLAVTNTRTTNEKEVNWLGLCGLLEPVTPKPDESYSLKVVCVSEHSHIEGRDKELHDTFEAAEATDPQNECTFKKTFVITHLERVLDRDEGDFGEVIPAVTCGTRPKRPLPTSPRDTDKTEQSVKRFRRKSATAPDSAPAPVPAPAMDEHENVDLPTPNRPASLYSNDEGRMVPRVFRPFSRLRLPSKRTKVPELPLSAADISATGINERRD